MNTYEKIIYLLKVNNGIISTSDVVKLGIDRKYLSILTQKGIIERSSRGVYILPDTLEDEFYSIGARFRKGIFSHDTALFLHDLTDRTPLTFSITLPKGYNPALSPKSSVEFFYVKREFHDIGKTKILSPHGKEITVYDMERTICDIVRSRKRIEIQTFTDALKRYSRRKGKDLRKLMKYSEIFKIDKKIRTYMEVLI
jgi:predicted transcriptional regulator of viral defense system